MRTAEATASPLCYTRLGGSPCRSPQTMAPRSTETGPGSQVGRPPNASRRYKIIESFLVVRYFSSVRLKSFVFLKYIPASWTRNSRRLWSTRHSGSTTARRTSEATSRWRGIPLWSEQTMSIWSCGDTARQVSTPLHTLETQSPRLEKKMFSSWVFILPVLPSVCLDCFDVIYGTLEDVSWRNISSFSSPYSGFK